jgi:hypothetical protein
LGATSYFHFKRYVTGSENFLPFRQVLFPAPAGMKPDVHAVYHTLPFTNEWSSQPDVHLNSRIPAKLFYMFKISSDENLMKTELEVLMEKIAKVYYTKSLTF